jgi:transcription elongation factor GreB
LLGDGSTGAAEPGACSWTVAQRPLRVRRVASVHTALLDPVASTPGSLVVHEHARYRGPAGKSVRNPKTSRKSRLVERFDAENDCSDVRVARALLEGRELRMGVPPAGLEDFRGLLWSIREAASSLQCTSRSGVLRMSKAFTKESDDDDDLIGEAALPDGFKNYMTPAGYGRLSAELARLWKTDRPKLVETIAWAAGNGDRSENGDYIYGKRKLREIDRRIRFLSKRLDSAVVVDNAGRNHDRIYFGATVTVVDESGDERTISIVGVDELDPAHGRVSWISPIATALLKASLGDVVTLRTPRGSEELEVVAIRYDELP